MIYTVKSQHYHLKHITITRLASAIKSIGPEGRCPSWRTVDTTCCTTRKEAQGGNCRLHTRSTKLSFWSKTRQT